MYLLTFNARILTYSIYIVSESDVLHIILLFLEIMQFYAYWYIVTQV